MIIRRALFPGLEYHGPSGRAQEFRLVGGQLQQLGADGAWARYVPFAKLREAMAATDPVPGEGEFLAGFERAWEAAAEPALPVKVRRKPISRCSECGRTGHNRRGCPERTREGVDDGHAAIQHEQPPGRDFPPADGQGHGAAHAGDGRGREASDANRA